MFILEFGQFGLNFYLDSCRQSVWMYCVFQADREHGCSIVDGHRFRLISCPPLIGLMMDQSAAFSPHGLIC